MANTTGTQSSMLVAASAAKFLQLLLADRTSLRGHPALVNAASLGATYRGTGSYTANFALFGLDGYNTMTATSEGSAPSETAITTALSQLTLARYTLYRTFTDDLAWIDSTGQFNYTVLGRDGFGCALVTLTSLIAGLADNFVTQIGTTGVSFDHDLFLSGMGALQNAKVPGPYIALLALEHFTLWQQDLESRAGVTQWRPATAEMQNMMGPGFKGTYNNVDVFALDKLPSSSSDKVSCMFGRGAILYGEQDAGDIGPAGFEVLRAGPILIEANRDGTKALSGVITHYRVGVTIAEDARGVGMLAATS